jgi:UDP-N-acetylmuramyl pentapeptide phosphotransferase/UDP-N-acetylglucosamine-1-phosphate transferase
MDVILSITTAFLVAFSVMPIVIRVFRSLNLLDAPDKRKIHTVSTPSLGGIAIYLAFMIALVFFVPLQELSQVKFLLLAIFLLFILGVRDDISSLQALDKLTIQIFSALLVVFIADIRFSSLHGFMGVDALPVGVAEFLSIFVIVGLTNAFNLIDGIDGLAGSVSFLVFCFFGWWFFAAGETILAFICVTIAAAVLGFLFYNWAPSKIFMGDTGSLVLGFTLAVMMIQFVEVNYSVSALLQNEMKMQSPIAFSFALLIVPVYDTLRVFIIRFMSGRSPLSPDKNHIHHILLKLDCSHSRSTLILLAFNSLAVATAWFGQALGNNWLTLIILITAFSFGSFLDYRLKRKISNLFYKKRKAQVPAH